MLGFFLFTGINEILPFLMGVLGLLMTWELHDLGVRTGRIRGLDISDPSVVRAWLRNHSRARIHIHATTGDSSACHACRRANHAVVSAALVQRVERRLAAQYEVTRVLAESSSLQEAGPSILKAIGESLDWELGIFWSVDEQQGVLRAVDHWHASNVQATEFVADSTQRSIGHSIGLPGRVWASAAPSWIHDIVEDVDLPRGPFAAKAGLHGAFAFPVRSGAQIYGVIEFFSRVIRQPDGDMLNMVDEIGIKIGQFLQHEQTELALRRTEAKLIEETKLAEVARMVADIGHDLKNLLTPIMLGASHVQGELEECESKLPQLDPEQTRATLAQSKEALTMIQTGARRLHDRVREIADSVKGLSTAPQFSQCRAADVVTNVFEALRLLADQKGVVLRAEQLDTLPPIMADESRLFNALYNLVNNAIPEVPRDGSVTVHGLLDPDAKFVVLSVTDTGRGIPPEVLESLFTYRATSRKHGGTGLGTKIVKDVVDAHGGVLSMDSKLGAGTTFCLTLPIDGPALSIAARLASDTSTTTGEGPVLLDPPPGPSTTS